MTTMRQARLAGMKANSELEQQVYHLQGELERLQQELKDEEAEAVDALELNSEVCVSFCPSPPCAVTGREGSRRLRIKLYRDMGFLPIEENGIFTKVVVRTLTSFAGFPETLLLSSSLPLTRHRTGSQQSRDARTVQLDESTSDYKWSEFLWDLASK